MDISVTVWEMIYFDDLIIFANATVIHLHLMNRPKKWVPLGIKNLALPKAQTIENKIVMRYAEQYFLVQLVLLLMYPCILCFCSAMLV